MGVLDERFLGSGRPYGEARLLWEIGLSSRDVRFLRAAFGLDFG